MAEEKKVENVALASEEAERNVLGSILLSATTREDGRVLDVCIGRKIGTDHFTLRKNKMIYETILKMNREDKPIDGFTLQDELEKRKLLDEIGGNYIAAIIDKVPTTVNAEYYLHVLDEKHKRRQIVKVAQDTIKKAMDENEYPDPNTLLCLLEKDLLAIDGFVDLSVGMKQTYDGVRERLQRLIEGKQDEERGLTTGIKPLEDILQGFKPGQMIVIGARPSVGKTTLAIDIATDIAINQELPVLVFSLEMNKADLVERIFSDKADVDVRKLKAGLILAKDRKSLSARVDEAHRKLCESNLIIEDNPESGEIVRILSTARRYRKRDKIAAVVVDYLSICMSGDVRMKQSQYAETSIISREMKKMAKSLGVPVIVASQLNRKTAEDHKMLDGYERPKMSDLRDSGAIEQDADVVMLLHRDSRVLKKEKGEYVLPDPTEPYPVKVIVAKNRNGITGEVDLMFDGAHYRFREVSEV